MFMIGLLYGKDSRCCGCGRLSPCNPGYANDRAAIRGEDDRDLLVYFLGERGVDKNREIGIFLDSGIHP